MAQSTPYDGPSRVGSIRPSQAIYSYGVGSLIDLPNLSVVVGGLSRWDTSRQAVVTEDRLIHAVRSRLGNQVETLRSLPAEPQTANPFDDWARVGVPVTVFPRWLRCTSCYRIFPVASGALKLETNPYRPDKTCYVHSNCDKSRKAPLAVPARFVTACANGHLDDFPWVKFAHDGVPTCNAPRLKVNDVGSGGRATDLLVTCLECGAKSTLFKAFGPEARKMMPQCRGRHPHLGVTGEPCSEQLRTMVLGAANLWFSSSVSVLSLPSGGGSVNQLVYDNWAQLEAMPNRETLPYAMSLSRELRGAFAGLDHDEIWAAIVARRDGNEVDEISDVLGPEWSALTGASQNVNTTNFEAQPITPPASATGVVSGVTLVHRLRVVTALCGFTRIVSPEPGDPASLAPLEVTGSPTWVPVVENRGEGVFIRLDETAVAAWERRASESPEMQALRRAHQEWRQIRNLDPSEGWPGERYVLLHSLSHVLINELAIECGYSSASIGERIYSRAPGEGPEPMAGILLYTSAPDSEGTLGGLVALGQPAELGPIIERALERAGLCSSDPLCADHEPDSRMSALHGSACHACLLIAETSCERGNRYLDRTFLVDTFRHAKQEFFK